MAMLTPTQSAVMMVLAYHPTLQRKKESISGLSGCGLLTVTCPEATRLIAAELLTKGALDFQVMIHKK